MFVSAFTSLSNLSDQELLEQYQSSDDLEALGTLYERHIHLVYGVSLKYLKETEESKDATMAIFEKLVTDLQKHEVRNFKSWLHVLTRNFCLMKLRSTKSSQESNNIEMNFPDVVELPDDEHHTDSTWESDLTLLDNCIEELKEEQKISVRLFFIEQKCYQDIVSSTGFNLKKVKSYIQNGKRNLRLCVEKNRERV